MTHTHPSLSTLLKKYGLRPRKGLGQNFLADPFHLSKIIEAAELSPNETVLEVGPGPGTLTRRLVDAAGQVIAVELDQDMVNLLQQELGHYPNLTIIQADILETDIATLIESTPDSPTETQHRQSKIDNQKSFKVVANLPYYITSAVLRHLLESQPRPERLVLTVQKEVAQRITAKPGEMSLLAVSVQFYGEPKLVHHLPAGAFYPPPKVDSAVVRIDTYAQPALEINDVDDFFRVVKAGFSQKRKQLKNTLTAGLRLPGDEVLTALAQANIKPTRRAQTLSLAEWARLVQALAKFNADRP